MEQYYRQIKEAYDKFYNTLLIRGQFPWKDTGIGYWGISVADEVFELFRRINLQKFDRFVDIGSGDGKVAMIASLFTKSTGIEFDPWLVQCSEIIKKKLGHIPNLAATTFLQKDFMDHHLGEFDVIYWHPDKPMAELEKKLRSEMTGKLIVHGPFHNPQTLKKEQTFEISGTYFNIFSN